MQKKGKLELTWAGKYDEEKPVEPRILLEDTEKSYGDPDSENMLIHGDNLIALQALQQDFAGKIKCIYIDPPFNTGQAFENYDDNLEMSIWLNLMRIRLQLLRSLLRDDGTLFVHIDDSYLPYLTILLDEIFGRSNRLYLVTFSRDRQPDTKPSIRGWLPRLISSWSIRKLKRNGILIAFLPIVVAEINDTGIT